MHKTTEALKREVLIGWVKEMIKTDRLAMAVYRFPQYETDDEIRVLVLSKNPGYERYSCLPLCFGQRHKDGRLFTIAILDATQSQLKKLKKGELPMPEGWVSDFINRFDDIEQVYERHHFFYGE